MLTDHWQKLTLNPRIYKYLRRLAKESKLPAEDTKRLQFHRLKTLLCDAYTTHPFYKNRFDAAGFDPFAMQSPEEIERIPILNKDEYREFTNHICQHHPHRVSAWYRDGTSGSTGMPLTIFRTWDERAYMSAKWMHVLYANGYSFRDVTFSIPSPHRLQRESIVQSLGLFKRHSVSYTAAPEDMVETYLQCRPTIIYANKSQLVVMALFCQANNITLSKPRLCISAAETMDANSRALITETFGKDTLVEAYGAVETNILAWQEQKKTDDIFRFFHTTNLLEVLDENNQPLAKTGRKTGRAVVTDFFIRSFPLIRYNLEDVVETKAQNGVTAIKKIKGRLDDWVIFSDGDRRSFHFFYEIMERRPEILQFRVIQEDYDLIRIQIVKAPDADAASLEKALLSDLHREVRGEGVDYRMEWTDNIPPDPNGKLRMLISKVQQNA